MLSKLERLKIRLMVEGVVVTSAAREVLSGRGSDQPLTLADYATTSGIVLRLEGDIWANAPIADYNPNFVASPSLTLDFLEGRFFIGSEDGRVEADPRPLPSYHNETDREGVAYTIYCATHADRVRISPVEGCAFSCRFCDSSFKRTYRAISIDTLLSTLSRAVKDSSLPPRHILISGGTPRREDFGFLREVYESVATTFLNHPLDIMMVPCPGLLQPKELAHIGINELSSNIELWGEDAAKQFAPQKAGIPRRDWLGFFQGAVDALGPWKVRSILLVGLEPLDTTLKGVATLSAMGVEPVLSPFRPDPTTPMADILPPNIEFLVQAFEKAREVASKYGAKLGPKCIPCQHNTLSFHDGSEYYHQYGSESQGNLRQKQGRI